MVENLHNGKGVGFKYLNQRKVYWDNSRFLSVNDFSHLYLPMTRMIISFWKNLTDLGEDVNILRTNTKFTHFN